MRRNKLPDKPPLPPLDPSPQGWIINIGQVATAAHSLTKALQKAASQHRIHRSVEETADHSLVAGTAH